MKRWWSYSILPAMALGLGLPVQALASTHCTVSIIMTTLGTDGTTVTQAMTVPPGATLQLQTGDGTKPAVPGPSAPTTSDPSKSPSGSGSSGSSGSNSAPQTAVPSGATSNPTPDSDLPVGDGDDIAIPVPTDTVVDEPVPPVPPVVLEPNLPLEPPIDVVDEVVDTPTPDTDVSEAPEPGTLTLLGLAALGGLGYARKKRKAA